MGDDMEAMTGLYDALNSRHLTRAVERFADPEIELHSRLVETEGEVFHATEEEALEAAGLSE